MLPAWRRSIAAEGCIMMLKRLQDLLERADAEYEMIHHKPDVRARETAADTHTAPDEFAKTVVVDVDGEFALAVLPATHSLAPAKLERSLGAQSVRLAEEWELEPLFPDVELGSVPPFGSLFNMAVFICPNLTRDVDITFNAGTHSDAVRMRYADFERLEQPTVAAMSRHEEERRHA
jgi:Ala-tRNA(Pro) deacylase